MTNDEFRRQYMGDFDDERSRKIEELAERYDTECECYDRTVCSGRNERGIAIPLSGHEQMLISRNARRVRHIISDEAMIEHGIEWREIQNVLRHRP